MPERKQFLAAIRAAPDDDAPRLIYADWLEEQGETGRADFIRFGVAAGEWGPHLETRGFHIGAAKRLGLDANLPVFRRGFIDELAIAPYDALALILAQRPQEPLHHLIAVRDYGFYDQGEPVFAASLANAEILTLPDDTSLVQHLLGHAPAFRCQELRLDYANEDEAQTSFAGLELPNVRRLQISFARPAALNRLFRQFEDRPLDLKLVDVERDSPDRPNLIWPNGMRRLDLAEWNPYAARRLLLAGELPPAEGLALHVGARQRKSVLEALSRWPGAAGLERLRLVSAGEARPGAFLDALGRALPNLSALKFYSPGAMRVDRPVDPTAWPALRELAYDAGPDGSTLLFAPVLAALDSLELPTAPPEFFEAPPWRIPTALRRLKVGVGDPEFVRRLARLPGLAGLEVASLDFQGCRPTAPMVNALARSAFGPHLKALVLNHERPTKALAEAAAKFGPRCDLNWHEG